MRDTGGVILYTYHGHICVDDVYVDVVIHVQLAFLEKKKMLFLFFFSPLPKIKRHRLCTHLELSG